MSPSQSTWFDDITITSLVTPPNDCLAPYSVFKFNLDPDDSNTGLRSWGGANSIQLAEITLYDLTGTPLREGLTCTNPGGRNPGGELPEHACNGLTSSDPNGCSGCANTGHKWLDFNKGDLIMTFDSPQTVASWDWQTANDAPARDPAKWTLEGSNDGGAWTVLDDSWATDKFDTTSARYTWQGPFVVTVGRDCDSGGNVGGGGIPNGAVSLGGDGQLVKDTRLPYVSIPLDCKYRSPARPFF